MLLGYFMFFLMFTSLTIYCWLCEFWGRLNHLESHKQRENQWSGFAIKDVCTVLVQPYTYVRYVNTPQLVIHKCMSCWDVEVFEGYHVLRGNPNHASLRKQRSNWNLQRRGSSRGRSWAVDIIIGFLSSWAGHCFKHTEVPSNGATMGRSTPRAWRIWGCPLLGAPSNLWPMRGGDGGMEVLDQSLGFPRCFYPAHGFLMIR